MNGSPLYEQLLSQLKENAEEEYASFHKRLLKDERINVLGVRVPALRKIARQYVNRVPELLELPDEYYEVTFVKLQAAAYLPYERFTECVDKCVSLIDNWATCDCFVPKCVKANKEDFYKYICRYLARDGEFYQRFALTTLLHFYVEEEWLGAIYTCITHSSHKYYYVHTAAAWLMAEILVKHYGCGVEYLQRGELEARTHNLSIRKACESFRLTKEQKEYLKTLKR